MATASLPILRVRNAEAALAEARRLWVELDALPARQMRTPRYRALEAELRIAVDVYRALRDQEGTTA